MKKLIVILSLVFVTVTAQNSVTYDTIMQHFYSKLDTLNTTQIKSIKDFGAIGDGIHNDSWAFVRASNYINSLNNVNYNFKLIIPSGTYKVGLQVHKGDTIKSPEGDLFFTYNGTASYVGKSLLVLTNCKNIVIEGETGSKIQYIDSLRYGSWNVNGTPYPTPTMPNYNYNVVTNIGNAIQFNSCTNVLVKNLELDGNINAVKLGGQWGDTGYQLLHVGVYYGVNNSNILVKNTNVHHFCLDGFEVVQYNVTSNNYIILDNCKSEYNGRQGMSWVGGRGLYMFNSKFNHTGRAKFSSSPTAGMDIEPEGHDCLYGYFENCEFVNNKGCGVVSDNPLNSRSLYHTFNNCLFWGTTNWSTWTKRMPALFQNCTFHGSTVHASGKSLTEIQYFKNCIFEDKYYGNSEYVIHDELIQNNNIAEGIINTTGSSGMLFLSDGGKFYDIDSCVFIANNCKALWLDNGDSTSVIKNSSIYLRQNVRLFPTSDFLALIRAVSLKNIKVFNEIKEDPTGVFNNRNYYINTQSGATINKGGNEIINCTTPTAKVKWVNWSWGYCNY